MDLILQYMTYLNDIIIEVPTNFYIYQLCMSYDGKFNFVANSFPSTKTNFVEKPICVYISDISAIAVYSGIRIYHNGISVYRYTQGRKCRKGAELPAAPIRHLKVLLGAGTYSLACLAPRHLLST